MPKSSGKPRFQGGNRIESVASFSGPAIIASKPLNIRKRDFGAFRPDGIVVKPDTFSGRPMSRPLEQLKPRQNLFDSSVPDENIPKHKVLGVVRASPVVKADTITGPPKQRGPLEPLYTSMGHPNPKYAGPLEPVYTSMRPSQSQIRRPL